MPFSHDHLHTLLAVIDAGSFDAAAAALHVTPSAVSQRIKALEKQCGAVLLQRSSPPVPTGAGYVVVRMARQVAQLQHEALAAVGVGNLAGQRPVIPVVVNPDSFAAWFLDALVELQNTTHASFKVHLEAEQHSATYLREGTVLAAVTATPEPVQGCRVQRLGVMRYYAVACHTLVDDAGGIDALLADLDRYPVLAFDANDDLQHRFCRHWLGRDLTSPIHYIPSSSEYLRALIDGLGWGLLTEPFHSRSVTNGDLVDLAPRMVLDVPLYWQRWKIPSPLLEAMTTAVVAHSSKVLGQS